MRTLKMKIAIPEVIGGRCVSDSELECKIDPSIFAGAWLEHQPTTKKQEEILTLYQDAKAKGRLHTFTCMKIDPSVKDGKIVYQKGLPIKTEFSRNEWEQMLQEYNPSRNSRQMTRTEHANKKLFLIWKLVESGYGIDTAWKAVCDNSKKIGHTDAWKFLAKDPWEEKGGFWVADDRNNSDDSNYYHMDVVYNDIYVVFNGIGGVGTIALD